MSKPANGAARNTMSEFERQCYDWGWEDAEERIIKLLEEHGVQLVEDNWEDSNAVNEAYIELIKGEEQ